jgi:Ohr subfamily peroxiredoxin
MRGHATAPALHASCHVLCAIRLRTIKLVAIDIAMSNPPTVLDKRLYTAVATATGGRDGRARSDDGVLDVALVPPKSLGGGGATGTNPEQLFAAGYAACFGSAIGAVARGQKVTTGPVSVTATVTLGTAGQAYGLAVELEVSLPELPRDQAEALVVAAHQVCPYSNATRGNIVVGVKLAGQ